MLVQWNLSKTEALLDVRKFPYSLNCMCRTDAVQLESQNENYIVTEDNCHYCKTEVFTAVTMKNAVFWNVAPCRSCVNRRFGGTHRHHLQGRKIREQGTSVSRWQVASHMKNVYKIVRVGK
jgi:hypothetical protein